MDPPASSKPDQAQSPPPAQDEDLQMENDEIEQQDGDEQERPVSPTNNTSKKRAKVRSRVTVVCAECKRLKLKCDRRTPCNRCTFRNVAAKCIYNPGANDKIDVISLHNRLVTAENLIEALVAFIGLREEDYMEIKNANEYPPRPEFKLRANVKELRAALGLDDHHSSLAPAAYSGDMRREELTVRGPDQSGQAVPGGEEAVMVAFANPKPRNPSYRPSTPSRVGAPSPGIGTTRRRQVFSARPSPDSSGSMNVAVARSMLDMASRVFSTTSTLASEESTGHLKLWANAFGWTPVVLYRSASVDPKADASNDDARLSLAAPFSEGDYQDRPRPAGLLTLQLANQLFHSGTPVNSLPSSDSTVITPSLGSSFDALGLTSPANSFPSSGAPLTPPVPNPLERLVVPPLVNPHDVISRLPSAPWRDTLWAEAENLMIIHEGISSFARSGVLKRRVDSMFEWAEMCVEQGSADAVSALSGSTAASSRASGSRPKGSRKPGSRGGTLVEEIQPTQPPTPPTASFFAVVSAIFALGALSYLCKSEHGLNGTMDPREKPHPAAKLPSDVLPPTTSAGEPSSSVNFGSIGVMGVRLSAVTFSMTGSGPSGTVPSNFIPTKQPAYDPTKDPLPDHLHPHVLHELSRAFILGHDTLRLPHSLDYLHAHILGWVYMLHPPDSPSAPTNANGGPCRGISGGLVTSVDQMIWKEIGKCTAVAQSMGLNDVDCAEDTGGDEEIVEIPAPGMTPWEREMRRRVRWSITYFELFISTCIGTLPSALTNSNSCKIPSDVDESRFDPKSTSLPPPEDPNFAMTHWVFKLRLVEIMSAFHRHSYINGKGVTPQALTDLRERLDNWKRALPERYHTTVDKADPDQTKFPDGQIVDVQACDLLITHNRLIMKAWYPYFEAAIAHPTLPSNQDILSTCVDAAIGILVTSKHLLSRFRAARPISFGYYGFGQPVWLSATLLASLAIASPESPVIGMLGEGLSIAVQIVSDFVVCGKADGAMKQQHDVFIILSRLKTIFERLQAKSLSASGSKRKSVDNSDLFKLQNGLAIPYVGPTLVTASLPSNPSPPPNLPESVTPSKSSRPIAKAPATSDPRSKSKKDSMQLDEKVAPPASGPVEQIEGSSRVSNDSGAVHPAKKSRSRASSLAGSQMVRSVDGHAVTEPPPRREGAPAMGVRRRRPGEGISDSIPRARTDIGPRPQVNAVPGPSNWQDRRNGHTLSATQPLRMQSAGIPPFEDPIIPNTGHRSSAPQPTIPALPGGAIHSQYHPMPSSASDVSTLVDQISQAPSSAFQPGAPPYAINQTALPPHAFHQMPGSMPPQGPPPAYRMDMEGGPMVNGGSYAETGISAPVSTMVQPSDNLAMQPASESGFTINPPMRRASVDDVSFLNNTLGGGFPPAGYIAPTPMGPPMTGSQSSFRFEPQHPTQVAPQIAYAPPPHPPPQHQHSIPPSSTQEMTGYSAPYPQAGPVMQTMYGDPQGWVPQQQQPQLQQQQQQQPQQPPQQWAQQPSNPHMYNTDSDMGHSCA